MKVVYNACYGGFSLSGEAVELARKLSGNPKWGECILIGEVYEDGSTNNCVDSFHPIGVKRTDKILVEVVEQLKDKANGRYTNLKICEVKDKYRISEYDGLESVEEPHTIKWES